MSWYYNPAGQRYALPEQALEPPDCWVRQDDESEDEGSELCKMTKEDCANV